MPTRLHISAMLFFTALVWGLLMLIGGVAVKAAWFHPFSAVVGAMVLLLSAFDVALWRWRWLRPWFVRRPDLNGTWRVTLRPVAPGTGNGTAVTEVEAFMVVRQTYSTLSMRLLTAESNSQLLGGAVEHAADGLCRVVAVYRNEPFLSVQERSRIHHGAVLLDVQEDPVIGLRGHYWTDRGSNGEMELTCRNVRRFASFASAVKAMSKRRQHATKGAQAS